MEDYKGQLTERQRTIMIAKIIFVIIILILGCVAGVLISGNAMIAEIRKEKSFVSKQLAYCKLYDRWLEIKAREGYLKKYFEIEGYQSVAIYGMGQIGKRLYMELLQEKVNVLYVIDRRKIQLECEVPCLSPDSAFPDVDVIVVTAICDYYEIKKTLEKKNTCPIISLEEIIRSLI